MFRCLAFASLLLTAALLLHTLHLEHHHPLEFGDGIQAMLHGEDRKWLIAALLAALFAAILLAPRPLADGVFRGTSRALWRPEHGFLIIVDPIRAALRAGIVHPKLFE